MNKVEWTNTSSRDTGNGAIVHRSTSPDFPSVVQFEFVSYCGRDTDKTWYEIDGDPSRRHYQTAAKAQADAGAIKVTPTETLAAELRRRGVKVG